jgi:hypothetical protein
MTSLLQLLEQPDVAVIPVDPESLDATRPDDLDVCPRCMGDGVVYAFYEGEPCDVTCPGCDGSGQRGVW